LLQVWECEYGTEHSGALAQQMPFIGLGPGKFYFHFALGNLTQRPTNMGEPQHEPLIKVCKAQKVVKL